MSALIWPPRRQDDHDRWYPPDWTEQALCAEVDPELHFPEKGGSTREAKAVCRACEVRAECLDYALKTDQRFGIWGGLSEQQRRRLKRERPATAPPSPQSREAAA